MMTGLVMGDLRLRVNLSGEIKQGEIKQGKIKHGT